jgi:hypothetical protein
MLYGDGRGVDGVVELGDVEDCALVSIPSPPKYLMSSDLGKKNSQIKTTHNANNIAGKRSRFCVSFLRIGGCWKILSRRVRTASRLKNCMKTRLTK